MAGKKFCLSSKHRGKGPWQRPHGRGTGLFLHKEKGLSEKQQGASQGRL